MSYVLSTCYPYSSQLTAARYAADLALALGCPLHIAHAYSIPYVIGEFPVPVVAPDDQRSQATQQLQRAVSSLHDAYPHLDIRSSLGYGLLAEVLIETIEHAPPLLTVIGNDESDDATAEIGIDTADIMAELAMPVMAVTAGAAGSSLKRMCLALTARSLQESASLEGLEALHHKLGFSIHVVTVSMDGDDTVDSQGPLLQQLQGLGAEFATLPQSGASPSEQIATYAASFGADCLGVLRHERGFWSALFHKSQTEALLRKIDLPVLAFHSRENGMD
jgi:nucleotide-binding universal stress UspA family protein